MMTKATAEVGSSARNKLLAHSKHDLHAPLNLLFGYA